VGAGYRPSTAGAEGRFTADTALGPGHASAPRGESSGRSVHSRRGEYVGAAPRRHATPDDRRRLPPLRYPSSHGVAVQAGCRASGPNLSVGGLRSWGNTPPKRRWAKRAAGDGAIHQPTTVPVIAGARELNRPRDCPKGAQQGVWIASASFQDNGAMTGPQSAKATFCRPVNS
jgi:hypothetical protein